MPSQWPLPEEPSSTTPEPESQPVPRPPVPQPPSPQNPVRRKELHHHKLPGLNECLVVEVLDEPGPGGAYHHYRIRGLIGPQDHHPIPTTEIRFQKGGLQEVGTNGHSIEAYLAVLIHRLECFQEGPFPCVENAAALERLREAMMWLQKRTRDRLARGVEGRSVS